MKIESITKPNSLRIKTAFIFLTCIAGFFLLGKELPFLKNLILHKDAYTHIAIIPLISAFFIWKTRKSFLNSQGNLPAGLILIICGAAFALIVNILNTTIPTALFLKSIGVLFAIYGALILCWGFKIFKHSMFALILLILAIPVPDSFLNAFIVFLQNGSAVMVDFLFTILGQAFVRDNNTFHLQTLSIFIAPECSGIRSTMALIITGAIAAEMFLKNWGNKILMLLIILPLSLLKNAIRITTITMLAQYVDISFLTHSALHKSGGILFYLIVLAIYFPLIFFVSRLEQKRPLKAIRN
jgi:exosortase